MRGALEVAAILVALGIAVVGREVNASSSPPSACRIFGEAVRLPELPEASGVAASRRTPGVLWAHNDSGDPEIFALAEHGSVTRRVRVTGAEVEDWEDLAVGPCPQGSCLYVGDIGDNGGKRNHITIYRTPEPSPHEASTRPAEVFHGTYPDGAHNPRRSLYVFVARVSR